MKGMAGLNPFLAMALMGDVHLGHAPAPLPSCLIPAPQTEEQKTAKLNKAQQKRAHRAEKRKAGL